MNNIKFYFCGVSETTGSKKGFIVKKALALIDD